ncbi:hypothetical protein [Candidatus Coxiella mudrowiae]|uniref:hypothetical protein n=1 Tax=Candidatus Coxiella mudrowiae TaxID=2054173 RepID=UPI0027D33819|nr:hypothetical protein [Candidatus Coxiella mudrowiae]
MNAGSNYVNQFVVKDHNLITSRNPNNLSKFFLKPLLLIFKNNLRNEGNTTRSA